MILLAVPLALASIVALLALATHLEQERARYAVRLTVRSAKSSPELCERVVASELATVLAAHGFNR